MNKYEVVRNDAIKNKGVKTILPACTDLDSAGDDFYAKETALIKPNESHVFWTDVKALIEGNTVLNIYVRSSIGIKKNLMLANGTGIIDKSYYGNVSNDGNIGICLFNYGNDSVIIEEGDRIAQGVLMPYISMDVRNNLGTTRVGGSGSSGN